MTNRDQLIANENRLMYLGNDEMERQEQEEKEDEIVRQQALGAHIITSKII